ncbi:ATP-binding cassette sub-family B member 10, mitochondrial precursor [Mus musculus]|uniref:ATP-binding cassette sub-family B member 10, mitochondrial n=2 Tax=Mus musculus TaxID=10090 RepID=ABCBA_MOUSE|nr:ATP-binding cassette sub-family B member 10, mitochondrial precursor [Mus musculus]Q9JI39.1 RecName: Full=ATP-binding cassette sub-family B member 10, mitochondrial; AltName: Full=ABC-mitochondrial erythroid protein; Short=ABC-me protein; AltName: Full=ATP-binding cassette transporter 10; Short=ABC transporter 10 protein; Flags: Precursor [Mus musculus]AAF76889.1 ABC transporter [Mus musculus]AAH46818.1 ATP-binding cassette, sub-family B (MDR/TAP), member 10 [Mus musculus]AAH53020.1 ATP-bind|eukprot:NP_062425.1 ATP-binding cassette sub-family B member 10, mitochondrial precursor [Mus musculus]
MRAPSARALLLIPRRGPAVRAWAPAVSSRIWLASEWTPLVRAWTSLIHKPGSGLRFPAPLSGLPGGVGQWATSSGARRCWVLAGPRAAHPLFARLQGAAATGVRDLGNDSQRRPAATGRSEVWKLLGLVRPERGRLSAAVGFLAVSSVITMSAPFFLGRIIDVIYTNPSEGYGDSLTRLCAVLTCVFLCGAAANGIRVYLMQSSGQSIVNRLRTSLFSSILRQEVAFFDKTRTGELINRLSSDTALLGRSVTENLSDGLRAGAQASVGVGMMFFVSPSLATFVLSVVPPISVLAVIYGRYLRKLSKATQDSLAEATQLAEERIGNIRTIRAFGKEMTEVEKYTGRVDQLLQLAQKEALARAGFFGAAGLSGNLIVLSVLYKGGLLMGSAHMTVGELSSFLMYAFWVGLSIGGLSSFYSELMKGLGAGGRLWELLERQPRLPFNEGMVLDEKTFQGALEFRNVHFTYPARPEVSVFQDFSLSIPSGSVTALVGPSGSGKSTVVSLLLRLYDPNSGTVSLDGHDIRQLNPVWLRSKIGTVSQEPVLFSCSVAENIAYGADNLSSVTAQQVERAAEVANAAEFIRSFPQGFDTVVGEKGILLSGGQKQRIAIARALLKNPKILLLDEATSALDAENEHLVQEALDRLMEGRTVLIIAHRLSTIKNANFVAVLDHGKICEHGTHEELLLKPNGLYRKLMNKQSFLSYNGAEQFLEPARA